MAVISMPMVTAVMSEGLKVGNGQPMVTALMSEELKVGNGQPMVTALCHFCWNSCDLTSHYVTGER